MCASQKANNNEIDAKARRIKKSKKKKKRDWRNKEMINNCYKVIIYTESDGIFIELIIST